MVYSNNTLFNVPYCAKCVCVCRVLYTILGTGKNETNRCAGGVLTRGRNEMLNAGRTQWTLFSRNAETIVSYSNLNYLIYKISYFKFHIVAQSLCYSCV